MSNYPLSYNTIYLTPSVPQYLTFCQISSKPMHLLILQMHSISVWGVLFSSFFYSAEKGIKWPRASFNLMGSFFPFFIHEIGQDYENRAEH
jgi:hypothetical protein